MASTPSVGGTGSAPSSLPGGGGGLASNVVQLGTTSTGAGTNGGGGGGMEELLPLELQLTNAKQVRVIITVLPSLYTFFVLFFLHLTSSSFYVRM